jgi:hypothetical protein
MTVSCDYKARVEGLPSFKTALEAKHAAQLLLRDVARKLTE